ncbi:cellulose 1,4-beta-cellobiosidase precursor [Phakopsora pachyrhizi]|uniref:Glucanase n=1 Tax=Phakopsora pachyrhizi TaxID=170000 RepID=A0AAV0B7W8_PHAPC|nr:cellulose 1,4-beta-cellobiosidase precursor [Phakopsora pachyrhizi]CAH7681829.1 cellulose 1,4-beta-cellobiosidase precursor [Phakopsora pachyrhizi]
MNPSHFLGWLLLVSQVYALQIDSKIAQSNPSLPMKSCTKSGCETLKTSITMDADMRPLKDMSGAKDCIVNNMWDPTLCPDADTCAKNCVLGDVDYKANGVTVDGDSLTMELFPPNNGTGSRLYLLEGDEYKIFKLLNKEISVDVDLSNLPCGTNAAFYFSEMDPKGGDPTSKTSTAPAGLGYCDAQSPTSMKFIKGKANFKKSDDGKGNTVGGLGYPCQELDIIEGNSISQVFTPHPCLEKAEVCKAEDCKKDGGVCDSPGCDFNPYRMGDTEFYGPKKVVDTTKKMTITTQFIAKGGELVEIRRLWVQNGKVVKNSKVKIPGVKSFNSISSEFCSAIRNFTSTPDTFEKNGGLKRMGEIFGEEGGAGKDVKSGKPGATLVFSIWIDSGKDHMLWLDGTLGSGPAGSRGTCEDSNSTPEFIRKNSPKAFVKFSNLREGELGSTFEGACAKKTHSKETITNTNAHPIR